MGIVNFGMVKIGREGVSSGLLLRRKHARHKRVYWFGAAIISFSEVSHARLLLKVHTCIIHSIPLSFISSVSTDVL